MSEKKYTIDEILNAFVYVRMLGRGGDNHLGMELTHKMLHPPTVDDTYSRKEIKQFLLHALESK
jgi:hypothetical protein